MMIREKAVDGFDGGIVVGFSLMVALLLSFAPDEALNSIPALIRPIVGNGFVMGVITVLILEHLIFRAGKKLRRNRQPEMPFQIDTTIRLKSDSFCGK